MGTKTNYTIAAACLLATLPMYRYLYDRAVEPKRSVSVVIVQPAEASPLFVPEPEPLAANERCVGGVVIGVNGNVYTQAVALDGHAARCEGRYRVQAR